MQHFNAGMLRDLTFPDIWTDTSRITDLQVWYSHSRWHAVEGGGGPTMAAAVLTKARGLLPDCLMLHFAASELEESRGEADSARSIFEEQVQVRHILPKLGA